MINERLKKFVFGCCNALFAIIRRLVEETLMLKRFLRKEPNYSKFKEWLTVLHGERFAKEIIAFCNDKRKKNYKPKD